MSRLEGRGVSIDLPLNGKMVSACVCVCVCVCVLTTNMVIWYIYDCMYL